MNSVLQRITGFFANFFAAGAGLSMVAVFLIIFVNSTRRYTLGKSVEWGEELPVFLAIYGIMFGLAWAYMQDRHVRFTILVDFIPASYTQKLYLLVDAITVFTGGLLAYSGYLFAEKRGAVEASGLINSAKELRRFTGWDGLILLGQMYPYQLAIAIGGLMLAIAALLRLLNRVSESARKRELETS
ncbi:MAG: TRAP transporter small permease subunit [Gammaproteobacteria bacterium]|nr:TRAP transporter small permease subunit [Gammaproteobacteria bacterium]MCP5415612.1 TRAP transporter small permease subunit [Chromatiaceae bacterium]